MDLTQFSLHLIDPEHYLFTRHALAVLFVGAGILFFGVFFLVRERWSSVGVRNWIFTMTESLWLLSFGMAYASRQDALAFRWFLIGDIGVVFIPAALFAVNVSIAQRERELRSWVRISVAVSLLFCAALVTTDHFITGLHHYAWGPAPAYGAIGLLFIGYFSVVGIASLLLFYLAYQRSTHARFRLRQRGFFICALIGYPASLDFAAKLGVPLYPFGYLFVAAYALFATRVILLYRLVDITPELATYQILETMQGAVIVVDVEGKVRVVNRAALEMLGYQKADLLNRDLTMLLPVPPVSGDARSAEERDTSREMIWLGRDGQRFDVNVSASPLLDEGDHSLVGTVYVAHDITGRKQAEERLKGYSAELQEANKKLKALDKLKSDFVSTVSHELRTPLTSIKAFVELILMKPLMQQERRTKALQIINVESDRLTRLINDLLDLSRIEAGMVVWRSEAVAVNKIIQMSIEGMLPLLQNKGLHLTTAFEEALPKFNGDGDRLVQVLTNLLSNAIKFTPAGGTITIESRQERGPRPQIVVSVADTGRGVPAEDIVQIFDKFHRSQDVLTDGSKGTGLGLTIARQIIEHHGGRIWATSTYGAGSTFSFTIPLDRTGVMIAGAEQRRG